jgi:serine/threonine protein kinase
VPPETCPKCSKPKSSQPGSLAQWSIVCSCEQIPHAPGPDQPEAIVRCRTCSKPLREQRAGSLTQWVFQQDFCSCDKPKVEIAPSSNNFKQAAFRGFDEKGEVEIAIDEGKFPSDRYKPIAILGAGANGTVYLSRDRVLGKRVAVKVLRVLDREPLLSFQNEARTTSKLSHANIVKVLDFGSTAQGIPFMVMEYIDGKSLDQLIADYGGLDTETAIALFIQLSDALHCAHSSNILHRDLKSSNIIVANNDDGTPIVHLIDFGVAKHKSPQDATIYNGTTMVGTPAYMSPDQALGRRFDRRSDIYSLGCIMFETVTGRQVFSADSALELIALHAKKEPPSILDLIEDTSTTEALAEIIDRCLAKNPDERFQIAKDLSSALRAVPLENSKAELSQTTPPAQNRQIDYRIVITLALMLSVAVAIGFDYQLTTKTKRERTHREVDFQYPVASMSIGPDLIDQVCETDEQLAKLISSRPEIRTVHLESPLISADGLRQLKKLKKLQYMMIRNKELLTVNHFQAIAELAPNLQVLSIDPGAQAESLEGLSELKDSALTSLMIYGQKDISQTVLRDISRIKSLRIVAVVDCHGLSRLSMGSLSSLPSLSTLKLDRSDISDYTLNRISALKKLIAMSVKATPITDQSLKSLQQCKKLRVVDLSFCPNLTPSAVLKYSITVKANGTTVDY